MSALRRDSGLRRAGGFILVEVLVALVLAGVLLTSLCSAALIAQRHAAVAAERFTAQDILPSEEATKQAWGWGPAVCHASWGAGPVLEVALGSGAAPDCTVGMWADGWPVAERSPSGAGLVRVEHHAWVGLADAELVVRVRNPEGGWGPPWRTIVPDSHCRHGATSGLLERPEASAPPTDPADVVVHYSASCSAVVQAAGMTPQDAPAEGAPLVLAPAETGTCLVQADEREQMLRLEKGRGFDVFF